MNLKLVTILLVEDEIITATTQAYKLIQIGHKVVIASTPGKAFDLIESSDYTFDLVLMDIDLGCELNGIQTAEIIITKHKIPVIFLTSNSDSEIIRQANSVSHYGYILKGKSHLVLVNAIEMAMQFGNCFISSDK